MTVSLDNLSTKWFVSNSNSIIKWSIIVLIIISFAYLTFLSLIFRDIKYPTDHPYLFTLETLLFSIGTGAIIFIMAYGRGKISKMTIYEFIAVSLKFGILHILLQFSGFYTYVFGYNLIIYKDI